MQQTQTSTPPETQQDVCTHELCISKHCKDCDCKHYFCTEPNCNFADHVVGDTFEVVLSEEDEASQYRPTLKRTDRDGPPESFSREKLWCKEDLSASREEIHGTVLPPLSLESYFASYKLPVEDQIRLCKSFANYLTALHPKKRKTSPSVHK